MHQRHASHTCRVPQLQAGGYNGETRTSARRAGGGGGSGLTAAQEVALQQARVDELMVKQCGAGTHSAQAQQLTFVLCGGDGCGRGGAGPCQQADRRPE